MSEKTYYIFRHARAIPEGEVYGDRVLTAPILPEGIAAIEKLSQFLTTISTDLNVSSEVLRCRQTAEIVSKITGKSFQFDKRLNEFYLESFETLRDRVTGYFHELQERSSTSILICTHGAVIAALKHLIIDNQFLWEDFYDYPHPGQLLIIHGQTYEKKDFN